MKLIVTIRADHSRMKRVETSDADVDVDCRGCHDRGGRRSNSMSKECWEVVLAGFRSDAGGRETASKR